MTLLDAPVFDEARYRRNRSILYSGVGLFVVLFIGGWLVSGMPVDWPWNWWTHFRGRMTINHFLKAVEQNDLHKAYGDLDSRSQLAAASEAICRLSVRPIPAGLEPEQFSRMNTARSRATRLWPRASRAMCC